MKHALAKHLNGFFSIALSALIPAQAALAESCPDDISPYRVIETPIRYVVMDALGGTFEKGTVAHKTQESIFVEGIADFIEARAKAELRVWFTDLMIGQLCEEDSRDLFPGTCALKINKTDNIFGIEQQYLALVLALRKDLEYLPACAIYRHYNGSGLGYMLKSVFEGYANNGKLDNLIYGLAERFQTLEPASESERIFVFSVMAYASAIEIVEIWNNRRAGAVRAFLSQLQSRVESAKNPEQYRQYYAKLNAGSAALNDRLHEFYRLRSTVLETTAKIKESKDRANAAHHFMKSGELLFDQLLALLQFESLREERRGLSGYGAMVRALYAASQAIEVHEYTRAFLDLKPVFDRIQTESKNEKLKKGLGTFSSYSGAMVSLAEAKSADDFSSRLDALASPVGAWRLKNKADMWSLTALPGIRFGKDTYSSTALPGDHEETVWGIGAPVGIQKTWHECGPVAGYCGLMLSILDVGNIIDVPRDIKTPAGNISGKVESDFSSVFTPGIYFTMSPRKNSPFNIALGYSEGPGSGYRSLISESGEEFPVGRDRVVSILLSIDVTFFTF
jgi:hypothetical protein